MPKAKVERIVSDKDGWRKVEVMVGQPTGPDKPATYTCFSTWDTFLATVTSADADAKSAKYLRSVLFTDEEEYAGEESAQALLMRLMNGSIDRVARSAAYEAAALESTFITAGDEKVDIMTFPLSRLVRGINGMRAQLDTRMLPVEMIADKAASQEEKDKILNAGKVDAEKAIRFGPWKTAAKKLAEQGKAKENTNTGMLELVA